ncbi:MAG: hypothetical protein PHC61_13100 [Chitinivibrionales bacterium]|nr:hypothetical protein [Chitinivibrionales bacterium]
MFLKELFTAFLRLRISYRTLFFVIPVVFSSLTAQTWQKCPGPEGGDIFCIYEQKNALYAGTYGGGIFKSTDAGSTWFDINNGLENLIVGNICSIGDTLFAATWGFGICRSIDQGKSWQNVFLDTLNGDTEIDELAAIGSTLFAIAKYGNFLRSTDRGASWKSLNGSDSSFLRFYRQKAFIKFGPYIYVASDYGIARSSNNGDSWKTMNKGLSDTLLYSLACDGSRLYTGTYSSGVFISDDSGASWMQSKTGLQYPDRSPNKGIPLVYDIKIDSRGIVYTGTGGGLFYSADRGMSWQKIVIDSTPEPSVNGILITNAGTKFIATSQNGVYRINGDSSAAPCNKGLNALTISGLSITNNSLAAATFYRGVFWSSDNGNSWSTLTNANNPKTIFQDGTSIFISDYFGIHKSADQGKTWASINNGIADSGWLDIFSFTRIGRYMFTGGRNGLWRLADADIVWKNVTNGMIVGVYSIGNNRVGFFARQATVSGHRTIPAYHGTKRSMIRQVIFPLSHLMAPKFMLLNMALVYIGP